MAIFTALALIIFIVEAQIPLPVPIPGVKLGLANAVTLFALFFDAKKTRNAKSEENTQIPDSSTASAINIKTFTTTDVFNILFCRIVLGAVFTGRIVAFIYSFTGGVLGFTAQVVMKRFVSKKQIWVCGAAGAVFHNIGQITAAIFITGTPAIAAYLPVLMIAGIITGALTGLIAQFALERIKTDNREN